MIQKISSAGCIVSVNKKLSELSSFRIGGPADFFVEIPAERALGVFLESAAESKTLYMFIGGGTNILFSDKGYRGVVAKLTSGFKDISVKDCFVSCGAAVPLPLLVKKTASENLSGLECCAGIPGTVGGAVLGNAGSSEKWIGDVVESVEVFNKTGQKEVIDKEEAGFCYRKSGLKDFVISKINFFLKKGIGNDILKTISENMEKRAQTQPLSAPSAGCAFKNPLGLSAGKLIEDAGLKGKKKGGAEVSKIHANFIINTGGAAACDVLDLIYAVRKAVKDKFNLDLELEIKIAGE